MEPPWTSTPLATAYSALGAINERIDVVERDMCRVICAGERHLESVHFESCWLDDLRILYGPRECGGTCGHESLEQSGWWKRITSDGPVGALDAMVAAVKGCRASRKILEDSQRRLRIEINNLWRPKLTHQRLLDLPDELLLTIFETMGPATIRNLDDDVPPPMYYCGRTSAPDIRSIRLVCRRFSELAAGLLVRLVRVYPTGESLARFDAISRHPTISKGIRGVLVVLHFYHPQYEDFESFAEFHSYDIYDHRKRFETDTDRRYMSDEEMETGSMYDYEDKTELIERAEIVRKILALLPDTTDECEGEERLEHMRRLQVDELHRPRILQIHEEFQRRFQEAEHLVDSGAFAQTVGAAMARLPGPLELGFGDADFVRPRQLMVDYGDDIWDAVHRHMLQPITALHCNILKLDAFSYGLVPGVIAAAARAGASPCALRLDFTNLWDPTDLDPSPDARRAITSGMPKLHEFSFSYVDYAEYGGIPAESVSGNLNAFLAACLDVPNLRRIHVDLGRHSISEPTLDMAEILGTRPRLGLTDLSLRGFVLRLPYLVQLLHNLPERLERLHLEGVCLQDGTWQEAVEVLRTKTYGWLFIGDVSGAEVEGMLPEAYEATFGLWGPVGQQVSLCTVYITSDDPGMVNPVLALQDTMFD
ncbi:hypothetical protein C8A05DRAFT_15096 [Staphylotrichum tortipilum]|uniref:F-box domain-containing protein n=1 Tax=Staphylotrichum tortipilum TaxID=2831512 RepID=A0AAN6RU70_9PEZI|nr:hypothetical protein C8A05DRAFT_15096 [Staphylotrichum longicolle]